MAFFAHTRPVADGVFGGGFRLSFGDFFAAIAAWNDRRITRRELSKLSDRELDDIGLCRADIDTVVSQLR
ncbi:MAG: putative conserved small protein [Rhodobacteraceae bacterium HLUCCA12]|nr:MAG: putative conserved small protein [Rhodobacteraceae bacterium HLUCCA12]